MAKYYSDSDTIVNSNPLMNSLAVCLNFLGAILITLAHLNHVSSTLMFVGYGLFVSGLALIFYLKAWKEMTTGARILVGGLFVVSGMIKANDPEGFSYKLLEYFEPGALDLESLNSWAFTLSVIVGVGEMVLGFAVILGGKMRLAAWALLALTLFFGWLTMYTANCNDSMAEYKDVQARVYNGQNSVLKDLRNNDFRAAKIRLDKAIEIKNGLSQQYQDSLDPAINTLSTVIKSGDTSKISSVFIPDWWRQCVLDCGCFGDALKGSVGRSLYPWESFAKDAILFYFVLIIFFRQKYVQFNTVREDVILMSGALIFIFLLGWVFDKWMFPLLFSFLLLGLIFFAKRLRWKWCRNEWLIALFVIVVCLAFAIRNAMYLPQKDFRPYAVGNNILDKMKDGKPGKMEMRYFYINAETKEEIDFPTTDTEKVKMVGSKKDKNGNKIWIFMDRKDVELVPEVDNSIQDFGPRKPLNQLTQLELSAPSIQAQIDEYKNSGVSYQHRSRNSDLIDEFSQVDMDEGAYFEEDYPDSLWYPLETIYPEVPEDMQVNLTDFILNLPKVYLIVSRHLEEFRKESLEDLNKMAKAAEENNTPVYLLTASPRKEQDKWKEKLHPGIQIVSHDEVELKIIIRSNPGVVVLENAVVTSKHSSRRIPSGN